MAGPGNEYSRLPKEGDVVVSAKFLQNLLKRIERLEKLQVAPPLALEYLADGPYISFRQGIVDIGMFELTSQLGDEASESGFVGRRSAEARIMWEDDEPPHDMIYGDSITIYDPPDIFTGDVGDQGWYVLRPNGRYYMLQLHC